jgi:UDP-N-acetylglucosamine--N-acetylmuramyl-(pentapeptide) pyrophosphoryl-undecaprenol N-acetylglucosamine transferase
MSQPTTIILAGGGTGGHLYPGIAVAEALRAVMPEAVPVFLCTARDIDRVILQPSGFEFIPQPIVPPRLADVLKFFRTYRETRDLVSRVLSQRKPAVVIGLGGYAAGVAVKSAAKRKIPTAIINPDVIPGKANQYLMRHSRVICCQFSQSRQFVPSEYRSRVRVTGCPIRKDILTFPPRAEAAARLDIDPRLHTLVVTGASLGALTVNEAMLALAGTITLNGWQILHLAGRDHGERVRTGYREKNLSARVIDFTADMADVWAVADLALSRSGASSCAELTACGVPSILMPYPFHKDLHQRANARVLSDAGAAVLMDDEKDARKNADKLRPILESLLYDVTRRQQMSDSAKHLGKPKAAAAVAEAVCEIRNPKSE